MKPDDRSLPSAFQALIRGNLLLPVILALVGVLAGTAYIGGREVENQQAKFNDSISIVIENFVDYASNELDAIAYAIENGSIEEAELFMQAQWKVQGVFDTIYLLDEQGIIRAMVPLDSRYLGFDMSRRDYYTELDCTVGINISDPFSSLRTGQPTVYLSRCIDQKWLLVGELNLGSLQDTVLFSQADYSQVSVAVIDQNGTLLAHPEFDRVARQDNISNWRIVQTAKQAGDLTLRYWRDGRLWIGNARLVQPMGWMVITEVPYVVVYITYLIAALIMTLLMVIIFSLAIQRFSFQVQQKMVRPLTNLSESTSALASGDYAASELLLDSPQYFEEIEKLIINFQKMSKAIFSRESLLKESEKQYRRLVENSPDAILVHHQNKIVYANQAAVRLYRAPDAKVIIGKSMLSITHSESSALVRKQLKRINRADRTTVLPLSEQKHIRFDQSVFDAEVITSSIFFEGGYEAQTIVRDISRRKDEEMRMKYLATHDFLTDLPNRFQFQTVLRKVLSKSEQDQTIGAVLYLDLDGFKAINDAYGHAVGDETLKFVARKLQLAVNTGVVFRLGGDEFVILLEDLQNLQNATLVANSILMEFSNPLMIENEEVQLSFSIGISVFPQDGNDPRQLLQAADLAMYKAKDEGKHCYKYYSSEMGVQIQERISIIAYLHKALEKKELFLEYQPQIDSETGTMIGVEALLRWRHPEFGVIRPGRFIDLAEETGLIIPVGEWIIRSVCQQVKDWKKWIPDPFHVAINLSNLQLKQPDLVPVFRTILKNCKIDPGLLELELSENVVFQSRKEALEKLLDLKSLGLKLAIDDFGTGYSTLGFLPHFPFDHLKIDQRLAPDILTDPKEAAIISGVITISNKLGLKVIAEGVESYEQIEFFKSQGCTVFQGYYYSDSVRADEITRILQKRHLWNKRPG
ncbi:MAG: EAL domain-containing protein [Anaerolineales bacterium]|nr:EAL domain-containing protein [Anaerolineales bacterium]